MNETKVDVLARIEAVWGRKSPEYVAVAELIESARKHNEAVLLFGEESVKANQTLWLVRDALARIGGDE